MSCLLPRVLPLLAALPAALLFADRPARAGITTYTNRARFQAAATHQTTFTFNGYAPKNGQAEYTDGFTVKGVTFSTNAGDTLYVHDAGQGYDPFGKSQFLDAGAYADPIKVALPAGATAFGADFSDVQGGDLPGTAVINGQSFAFHIPDHGTTGPKFFGFTSTDPITSLSFSAPYGLEMDNVSFRPANPVPEASSVVSLALLLALGAWAVRRAGA